MVAGSEDVEKTAAGAAAEASREEAVAVSAATEGSLEEKEQMVAMAAKAERVAAEAAAAEPVAWVVRPAVWAQEVLMVAWVVWRASRC